MNKIIEILELKKSTSNAYEKKYIDYNWNKLWLLKNGHFYEDENEIVFYTSENEKIDMPKSLIFKKTSSKEIYWTIGSKKIEKNLIEKGIFEITDRFQNYIKLKVEPMYDSKKSNNIFKKVKLNSSELGLLAMALMKNLFPKPLKGEILVECDSIGNCTLYFDENYFNILVNSMHEAHIEGKFAKSNAEKEWVDLYYLINSATEVKNIDKIKLKTYFIYEK